MDSISFYIYLYILYIYLPGVSIHIYYIYVSPANTYMYGCVYVYSRSRFQSIWLGVEAILQCLNDRRAVGRTNHCFPIMHLMFITCVDSFSFKLYFSTIIFTFKWLGRIAKPIFVKLLSRTQLSLPLLLCLSWMYTCGGVHRTVGGRWCWGEDGANLNTIRPKLTVRRRASFLVRQTTRVPVRTW